MSQFLKSTYTKCLYYYLYYLDKEYGFMFVKIQTWFPFNIQVYINGREWMKHVFDVNEITYECYDNSFTDISDVAKAQELADKFDSHLHKRLRLTACILMNKPAIGKGFRRGGS